MYSFYPSNPYSCRWVKPTESFITWVFQLYALGNDYDIEDEELAVISAGPANVGMVQLADRIVRAGCAVQDSFSYTVADSGNETDTGTVAVTASADGGIVYYIYLPVGLR